MTKKNLKTSKPKATKTTAKPASLARRATKTVQLIGLLESTDGASIEEMMKLSGWQSHSVRGFMAGTLKKQDKTVTSSVSEGGVRRYRLGDAL